MARSAATPSRVALGGRVLEGGADGGLGLGDPAVVLHEAARDELGRVDELLLLLVEDAEHGDLPLGGERPALLERLLGRDADGHAVDEDVGRGHAAGDRGAAVDEVDAHAVLDDERVLHARALGERGVGDEVAPLAVHRQHVAGLDEVVAVHELAGAGVPGDVHLRVALVHDVGAPADQAVDHAVDGVLVAGDERAGEEDRVALAHLDDVLAARHAAECRHRLALRARADERDLVVRQLVQRLEVDDEALGDAQVAEVGRDLHVADHRAAHERDLAAVLLGGVEHLLDPVHVAREAGDDDALGRRAEHLLDGGREVLLGGRETGDLRVGGVGEEEVHALLAEARERGEVGEAAVHRELIHLEVARVQDHAGARADRDGEAVGDGVVHGDELEVELARGDAVALLHLAGDGLDLVLLELRADEREREPGSDDGDVGPLLQEVGDAADVVLVAVREDDARDLVEAPAQGAEVGEDHVDAGLALLGEEHAAVDDEQLALVLEQRHVAADVAEAAEGRDAQAAAGQAPGLGDVEGVGVGRGRHGAFLVRSCG